ncbi:ferrous iron transport protein B [Heliophilum fasciatum]|uniref:Ferrous iron transport protein B n=1 Tax=Heliophilum fasciatum TaxID=35700 RepID=A0A4R2RXH4_9FIRM|nr:ferrous iron transport protein B [Heliophilum fasciatum]MCW2277187.1 ferrous iron transport protein B [Heliophilum fasciatum]TCP68178.1 ferrous iron transport protein B [Heliophilum fasciatum]
MAAPTCHGAPVKLTLGHDEKKLVLAGNPNVGKSVFFNHFSGMYVDVSNYPGTTLDIAHGHYGEWVIVDTPGIYGLSSFNDEERIARDVIIQADQVLNVVSALHLERDLFLTQQIIDTGVPVIVALNMVDEARRQGIAIDIDGLARELGVPVVSTIAVRKEGFAELEAALTQACPGRTTPGIEPKIEPLLKVTPYRGEALLALEGDPGIRAAYLMETPAEREQIYLYRRQRVNQIVETVTTETTEGAAWTTKLGYWMVRPVTGIPMLLAVMYFMYKLIGVWVAGDLVELTEGVIMEGYYVPWVHSLLSAWIDPASIIGVVLFGQFGLLTMTFTYVLGLLLPMVVAFYLFLGVLEDSGYLPRIAALTDRMLNYIGLSGSAVIPFILGFGCVTLATITTRVLASEREKRIAVFLLGLVIPCSAQLGVITGILATIDLAYALMFVLIIASILVSVGMIMDRLIPGRPADLFLELPPVRVPIVRNVLTKTWMKSYAFTVEAIPIFGFGALLISLLQVGGALTALQDLLEPLTVGWLHLPKETSTVFVMGLIRRDFGAAGLANISLGSAEAVVALVTLALFVPCFASVLVMFKERSKKEALVMWFSTWVIAFVTGGIVAQFYGWFGSVISTTLACLALQVAMVAITYGLTVKKRKTPLAAPCKSDLASYEQAR